MWWTCLMDCRVKPGNDSRGAAPLALLAVLFAQPLD